MDDLNTIVEPINTLQKITFGEKFAEYQVLRCNHPGFLPLIIQIEALITGGCQMWFKMYLHQEILVGHLRDFLRKMLQNRFANIAQYKDNIALVVSDFIIIKFDVPLNEIYQKKAEKDGWLYITIAYDYQK
ncbi:unnamed protein product [Paramecium primaurelia]|uniref:Autophagy protein ATG5 UblB domain-containing protein n=1 Tax=Paramecium primaurelia TaxID=5886 RepID=A0A8S1Q330_PARPR|nr:unnamed protein product [Paramecium primaurelia]